MPVLELSIVVRCSDDDRVLKCLDSIDVQCDVVVALTPSDVLEQAIARLGIPYVVTPTGNPAATTLAALRSCKWNRILLIDADCVFLPGAISRMFNIALNADIVRPSISFASDGPSSYWTSCARHFQYTYCGFVYEPGLLINMDRVLPRIGGYLFSRFAPYTPDGELDYRLRRTHGLIITTDKMPTLVHAPLSFRGHLYSYWRYGLSEASRMKYLNQPVLREVWKALPFRYKQLRSGRYPGLTLPAIFLSDVVYLTSMMFHKTRCGKRNIDIIGEQQSLHSKSPERTLESVK